MKSRFNTRIYKCNQQFRRDVLCELRSLTGKVNLVWEDILSVRKGFCKGCFLPTCNVTVELK